MTVYGCDATIEIDANLTPSTSYTIWLEDNNGNIYVNTVTTSLGGSFTIDTTDYPSGMFNAYSGSYEVSVSTSSTEDTSEELTINGSTYYCILLTFKKITDVTP